MLNAKELFSSSDVQEHEDHANDLENVGYGRYDQRPIKFALSAHADIVIPARLSCLHGRQSVRLGKAPIA